MRIVPEIIFFVERDEIHFKRSQRGGYVSHSTIPEKIIRQGIDVLESE
jgi:hypothetical protein